jgi:hypothetical protein
VRKNERRSEKATLFVFVVLNSVMCSELPTRTLGRTGVGGDRAERRS